MNPSERLVLLPRLLTTLRRFTVVVAIPSLPAIEFNVPVVDLKKTTPTHHRLVTLRTLN